MPALELLSEVSDLATGVGLLTFVLAPLALPILALTALVLLPALILAVVVALLVVAPILVIRRSRAGASPDATRPSWHRTRGRLTLAGSHDANAAPAAHDLTWLERPHEPRVTTKQFGRSSDVCNAL